MYVFDIVHACSMVRQCISNTRVCRRAAQSKVVGEHLDLLRRTRLSVACELVRTSVAHSRHLIELYTDATRTRPASTPAHRENIQLNADEPIFAAAESARFPGIDDEQNGLQGDIFVAALDSARWGASSEGISDSGSGHGNMGEKVDGILVRMKTLAETAAGSDMVSPNLDTQQACLVLVAQIAEDAIALCRKGTSFLLQAFAAIAKGENGKSLAKHEPANTTFNARVTGAVLEEASTPRQILSCDGEELQRTINSAWVFTGVVETLILAGAFSATIVACSGKEQGINRITSRSGVSHDESDEGLSGEEKTGTPVFVAEEESETFGGYAATVVARQLDLLHQNVFPKLVRSSKIPQKHERDSLAHSGPGEAICSVKLAAARDTDFVARGEEKDGRCSGWVKGEPSQFAIPFASRCMPIVTLQVLMSDVDQASVIRRAPRYIPEDDVAVRDKMNMAKNQATARKVGSKCCAQGIVVNLRVDPS